MMVWEAIQRSTRKRRVTRDKDDEYARFAEQCRRLSIANKALAFFAPDTTLLVGIGKPVAVSWTLHTGETFKRRWMTRRGQDFYPTWYRLWCHGGTSCTAMAQLVRWIKDKPVLPLLMWRHWCGQGVMLAGERGPELIALLTEAGWPEQADCVLCHKPIEGSMDWWSLKGVSGPCCSYRSGCRQKEA